ncbi:MAG: EamA family transporter [Acaryochloridaceae cyanobacterium CSU_3_4]|nr:EamA family transporter [Acaryochloridaceae cyanobacterium CSU_3_4]
MPTSTADLALGEFAALSAAFLWALASAIYSQLGKTLSPLLLNLSKGWVAVLLLCLTLAVQAEPIPTIPITPFIELSLSGAIGIGIGDTLYFETLRRLGVRLTLLLGVLTPSITAVLALLLLHESLSGWAWLGMILTLAGIAWVIQERSNGSGSGGRSQTRHGLILGFVAVLVFAASALLSRDALATTSVTPLWSALIRLGAGTLSLTIVVMFQPQTLKQWKALGQKAVGLPLVGAAFLGTYLGIWLQQIGFKYAPAGICPNDVGDKSAVYFGVGTLGRSEGDSAILGGFGDLPCRRQSIAAFALANLGACRIGEYGGWVSLGYDDR